MALKFSLHKKVFRFSFNARTSRGLMRDRSSWFFKIWNDTDPAIFGLGECAPLLGLSNELDDNFEPELARIIEILNASSPKLTQVLSNNTSLKEVINLFEEVIPLSQKSSVRFALETALLDLRHGGNRVIFSNSFLKGQGIPINGLIWMGGMDFMLQQVEIKIRDGFKCIKLKVGGLDFERECDVLQYIRRKYFRDNITIRLDANGAFKDEEAMYKLKELSKYDIHSIEQPLEKGSEYLADLCRESPIPIALDEELIGVNDIASKEKLLDRVRPHYVILKPSLHGGLSGCQEWIELADKKEIEWWVTSALESTVGLNAIAQFAANYQMQIPQGLGTGQIYENNFSSPLEIVKDCLIYGSGEWDFGDLFSE